MPNPRQSRSYLTRAAKGSYLANRWAALDEFGRYAAAHGFPLEESTAVIVDIDKTALGARGRNGQVIDAARVQAVHHTVAALLGSAFDPQAFRTAYDLLNQPEFHPFTADNQDYLAYICLILGSGLYRLENIVDEVRGGRLASFEQFIAQVDARQGNLAPQLAEIHTQIYANVQQGDPTPFKSFRHNEYLTTIRCFGALDDDAPLEARLNQEILVTQEVRVFAGEWRKQGALLFGLSDKPDEAATPTPELAAQGYLPIHRADTHGVGEITRKTNRMARMCRIKSLHPDHPVIHRMFTFRIKCPSPASIRNHTPRCGWSAWRWAARCA